MHKIPLNRILFYEKQTGYQILDHYLGHGTQGIVFALGNRAVKLSTDYEEVRVATWAMKNPHPYLPVIQEIKSFPKNIRAVIREPLDDIIEVSFVEQFKLINTIDLDAQAFHFLSRLEKLQSQWSSDVARKVVPLLTWLHQNFRIKELFHFNFGLRGDQLVARDLGMLKLNQPRLSSKAPVTGKPQEEIDS